MTGCTPTCAERSGGCSPTSATPWSHTVGADRSASPRDWQCSVGLDRGRGWRGPAATWATASTTTNLAGRTLADLLTGTDSALTRLAWVDHRSRPWEPEPLRWIGINGLLALAASSDRYENRNGRAATRRERFGERMRGG